MDGKRLRRGIDERIIKLKAAIESLPEEYTPEAYDLWVEYNEQLRGLAAIRTKFCQAPETTTDPFPEVLY